MNKRLYSLLISLVVIGVQAFGQSKQDSTMFKPNSGGLQPKVYQKGLSNINVSGYYRFSAN